VSSVAAKDTEKEYKLRLEKVSKMTLEQIVQEANESNKKDEIGSKAFNSLKLEKINKKEGNIFKTP